MNCTETFQCRLRKPTLCHCSCPKNWWWIWWNILKSLINKLKFTWKVNSETLYSLVCEWNWIIAPSFSAIPIGLLVVGFLLFLSERILLRSRNLISITVTKSVTNMQNVEVNVTMNVNKSANEYEIGIWMAILSKYPIGVLQSKGNLERIISYHFSISKSASVIEFLTMLDKLVGWIYLKSLIRQVEISLW